MPKIQDIQVKPSPWRPLSESEQARVCAVAVELIKRLDYVTDWRLQKTYYLAEVWSIEERIRRLSALDFASWNHGPWSLPLREAEEALETQGILVRVIRPARRRPEAEFLKVQSSVVAPSLPADDAEFLEAVIDQVKFLDGETLTRVTKTTSPYQLAKPMALIDLDGHLESLRRKHERLQNSPRVVALIEKARRE